MLDFVWLLHNLLQFGEAGGELGNFDFDVIEIFFGRGFALVAQNLG